VGREVGGMSEADLKKLVKKFIAEHRSLRQAADVIGVSPGYLSRLASGLATNPSYEVLDAMGIHRMVVFQRYGN
jgi:transcriptional regulator with XRE-family HTH domain